SLPEPSRDGLIGLARLGHPGRVVVGNDDRSGIVKERLANHLPWMHARAVDRATENLLKSQQSVAIVEEQAAKDLVWAIPELGEQEPARRIRLVQGRAAAKWLLEVTAGKLKGCHQRGIARRPDAQLALPPRPIRAQQLAQGPEFRDQ